MRLSDKKESRLKICLFLFTCGAILFSNSYIHPDENYQSLEPLIKLLNNGSLTHNNGSITWEYLFDAAQKSKPIRSLSVLCIYYGLILKVLLNLHTKFLNMTALDIIHGLKLYNLVLFTAGFIKFNNTFNRSSKQNRFSSFFYMFTSYTLLTYQVRFFSNSIETLLVMLSLIAIKKRKFYVFGGLVAIGFHNRVTFPSWLVLPCLVFAYKEFIEVKKFSSIIFKMSAAFLTVSYAISKTDSFLYGNNTGLLYTPFENILYNKSMSNLSKHGIHSKLTHILVNTPILMGPFLLFARKFKKSINLKNLPLISAASGILFHSFIPHQEARFLIPAVPLLIVSCDYTLINGTVLLNKMIVVATLLFNIVLFLMMGSLHQSGVINLLNGKEDLIKEHSVGYWHTLMPLYWPYFISLEKENRNDLYINFVSAEPNEITGKREFDASVDLKTLNQQRYQLFDFMGIDCNNLFYLLSQLKDEEQNNYMFLILPYAFLEDVSKYSKSYEIVTYDPFHLNLNDGIENWPFGLYMVKIEY